MTNLNIKKIINHNLYYSGTYIFIFFFLITLLDIIIFNSSITNSICPPNTSPGIWFLGSLLGWILMIPGFANAGSQALCWEENN